MKNPPIRDPHLPSNSRPYLAVQVTVRDTSGKVLKQYVMNHEAPNERAVLGEQCFAAFRARQSVATTPL